MASLSFLPLSLLPFFLSLALLFPTHTRAALVHLDPATGALRIEADAGKNVSVVGETVLLNDTPVVPLLQALRLTLSAQNNTIDTLRAAIAAQNTTIASLQAQVALLKLQAMNNTNTTSSTSPPPSSGPLVLQISMGDSHVCALLDRNFSVRCWGADEYGQLGDGGSSPVLSPAVSSDVLVGVQEISCGYFHTCALMLANFNSSTSSSLMGYSFAQLDPQLQGNAAESAICWGRNDFAQLGIGSTKNARTPILKNMFGEEVLQVAAGFYHTCVLMGKAGTVRCFGWNDNGMLGVGNNNTNFMQLTFPTVDTLVGVAQIAAGLYHTCAVMLDKGSVRCWGANPFGQLGTGSTAPLYQPSVEVMSSVTQVVAGDLHTCVLLTDSVKCWGGNEHGQAGLGNAFTTSNAILAPPITNILSGVSRLAAGSFHTCALMSATQGVRCWGRGDRGQLGVNSLSDATSPPFTDVNNVPYPVSQLEARGDSTCVLMAAPPNNAVRCWGRGSAGQLGLGSITDRLIPPTVDVVFA